MWEGEHFWKQIVLVEVLQIVNLIEGAQVVTRYVLDLVHDFFVVQHTAPEHAVVVLLRIELRRLILNLVEVSRIF